MNTHGHFSPDGHEYHITTPHPPRDWFNFLWNPAYLACVGQNMNGFSLYQNEAGVVTNLFGKQDDRTPLRALYLHDRDSGEFWSVGFQPCWTEHDQFECRHGLGYSVLNSEKNGVQVEFRVFVPHKHPGEIWTVRVTNTSKKRKILSLFSATGIRLDGMPMPYGYLSGLRAEYMEKDQFLFFRNTTHTVVHERYRAFMYSDRKPSRWDTSKDIFLGRYGNPARPQRVEEGRLGNSMASVENLIGALQHNLTLKPDASTTVNLVLGVVRDLPEARKMKRAFEDRVKIENEFEATKKAALQRLGKLEVKSPDEHFNNLFTVWQKHQLYLMADWARFYFKGYRDTCQDAAGMSILNPVRAQEMLIKALENQRSDGFCPRAFRVASMNIAAADKHYADSPSWISHATDTLIRETGDLSILSQKVAYSDKGSGTIWKHNLQAMEFLWNDRGPHGLSLIHYGDWNDLMDKVGVKGRGESVWMSCALARVLRLVGQLARWQGDKKTAALCKRRHTILQKNILKHGWDGKYFLYAINDDGMPIGTQNSKEGKVFINPQSWAMLSGVIDADEYTKIAEHIEPIVDSPVGPVHNWPAFTTFQDGIGQLSGTPPGFTTNGNVYCHAAGFKIAADFEAGRNDKAFDTLMRILPNETKSEPYAQANGYIGPSAMRMTRHVSDDPWRTGTIAWNWLNVMDRLLGFRRTLDGFELKPQLPSKWKQVHFVRPFRGKLYEITIQRAATPSLTLDGHALQSSFIPVPVQSKSQKQRSECHKIICTINK